MSISLGLRYGGASRGDDVNVFRLPRPVDASTVESQQKNQAQPRTTAFIDELKKISAQNTNTRAKLPTTGHAFLDFELNDAQIETKVKQLTHREMMRQQNELKNIVDSRTQNLRDYIENQLHQSQLSVASLRGDLKTQINSTQQSSSVMQVTKSPAEKRKMEVIQPQTQAALQRQLVNDIQHSLLAETLQCRPITGIDLPLGQLDAKVLQVEDIQAREQQPLKQNLYVLQMLLPNELRVPILEFLDEEDVFSMPIALKPKKTEAQKMRDTKLKIEEQVLAQVESAKEDELMQISAEQREQTIKCLLKVLNYQIKATEEQANDVLEHAKRNDKEIDEFKQELLEREKQFKLSEMNEALEKTKRIAGSYRPSGDDDNEEVEYRLDIAEILADNQVLLARVDQALNLDGSTAEQLNNEDTYSLTESLIDGLYNQVRTQENKKKKQFSRKSLHQAVTTKPTAQTKTKKRKVSNSKPYPKIIVDFTETQQERSSLTQEQIQTLKKSRLDEIQKRRQLSPPTKDVATEAKVNRRQEELARLDNILNQELGQAMYSMASVLTKAFK